MFRWTSRHPSVKGYVRYIGLFFACIGASILIICSLQQIATTQLLQGVDSVTHTYEVILKIETVLSTLKDAETGQRGYLITGIDAYLEPYNRALSNIDREIEELRALVSDSPTQQARVQEIIDLSTDKRHQMAENVAAYKSGDTEKALELVRTGVGKATMDKIRGVIDLMTQEELWLLDQRRKQLGTFVAVESRSSWLILFVCSAVLMVCWWIIQRENDRRLDAERRLEETISRQRYAMSEATSIVDKYIESGDQNVQTIARLSEILSGGGNVRS